MSARLEFDMGGGAFLPDKSITLKVWKVGQEHCDPQKKHESRRWDTYSSLHFVLFGKGTLIAGGKKIPLSKGDVFLLYKGEEYEYFPDKLDPWSYVWIDFYSSDAVSLFSSAGFSVQKPYVHLNDLSESMGTLKLIYEAYDANEVQQMECSAYFMLLLSSLIKSAVFKKSMTGFSSTKHRHLREIITFINNNFRLPLTIQKIAAENHLSVSRMMAIFSELAGMSPVVYLTRFRISTACGLLRKTDYTIGEVASYVGLEDQLYFSRVFRKLKGMSPRDYRASGTDEDAFAWLMERDIDFR